MDPTRIIIFFQNNFLFNYIITKIDNFEIKHQPNIKVLFLDRDNLIKKWSETNYEIEFIINPISKNKIKKTN
jgi:hypothetical protein